MRVTAKTEICIEGFPRSANSYAVVAFKLENKEVKVGHHLHVAAQIKQAAMIGIPNVVLIRNPADAVTSFLVFQSSLNAKMYLKSYIQFHQALEHFLDKILFVSFETVTSDFNKVILAINERFGKHYNNINNIESKQDQIFKRLTEINNQFFAGQLEKNMVPDNNRKNLKTKVKESVINNHFFNQANIIYDNFKALSI